MILVFSVAAFPVFYLRLIFSGLKMYAMGVQGREAMLDKKKAEHWAKTVDGGWGDIGGRFIYHKLPAFFNFDLTWGQILLGLLNFLIVVAVAAFPFIVRWYVGDMEIWDAMELSIILILLLSIRYFLSKLKMTSVEESLAANNNRKLLLSNSRVVEDVSKISELTVEDFNDPKCKSVVQNILKCVELVTRSVVKDFNSSYFEVTLLLFVGEDHFMVYQRANIDRSVDCVVNARQSVAYYCAKIGKSRKINNIKKLEWVPYKSLTQDEKPQYRSIMMIPLLEISDGNLCKAVVCIDSGRKYEFAGANFDTIRTHARPFLKMLEMLLVKHKYGVSVEG